MGEATTKTRCPRCDGKGSATPGGMFKCSRCGAFFDAEPDEGGDYSDRNPAARMEREERRKEARP